MTGGERMTDPLFPGARIARPELEALVGRTEYPSGDAQWIGPSAWDRRHVGAGSDPVFDWAHIRVWRPSALECVVLASGIVTPEASRPMWGDTLERDAEEWVRLVTARIGLSRRAKLLWHVSHPDPSPRAAVGGNDEGSKIRRLGFARPGGPITLGRALGWARASDPGWDVAPRVWERVRLEELERAVGGGIVRFAPGLHRPELIAQAMKGRLPIAVDADPFDIRGRLSEAATLKRVATMHESEGDPSDRALVPVLRMAAAMLVEPLERMSAEAADLCRPDDLCDVRRRPLSLDAKALHDVESSSEHVPRDDLPGALMRIRAVLDSSASVQRPVVRAALIRAHDMWAGESDVSPIGPPDRPGRDGGETG